MNLVAIHEVLVLKSDGRTERFPVTDGDVAQAELRAFLSKRPGDDLVVVTEHAYIRSSPRRRQGTTANGLEPDGS